MASEEIKVFDASGTQVGSHPAVAGGGKKVAKHLLHQVVRWQRAKRRMGTHCTKTRAEVTGGGKKPWKQKGTGRARAGSNTSPLWVGGGIAHGPKPRDYEFRMNKKEKKRALQDAITSRSAEGRCMVVENFGLKQIKTKDALGVLTSLGIRPGQKTVVVVNTDDTMTATSLRNIKGVKVLNPIALNVYDVLASSFLVFTAPALEGVEARFGQATNAA